MSSPSAPVPCPQCGTPVATAFCTTCGYRRGVPPTPASAPVAASPAAPPGALRGPHPPAAQTSYQPPAPPASAPTVGGSTVAGSMPPSPGNGRRVLLRGLLAFVLLVALGLGSVLGFQWWRDRPVNLALEEADKASTRVLDRLAGAEELADLAAAGEEARSAAAAIGEVADDLSEEDGELAEGGRAVLADQQALMTAVAPMAGLSEDSLAVWGTALPDLEQAQSDLLASRRALAEYDEGAGARVTDPRPATEQATDVVTDRATKALSEQLTGLLEEMRSVRTTSEAAALGERASGPAEAAAAVAGDEESDGDSDLAQLDAALGAVADLSTMDPESLFVWQGAEVTLAEATAALEIDSRAPRESMNTWVSRASIKMDTWRAAYETAETTRSAATADLDSYAEEVRRILRGYDRARDATSDALEAAELDDYSASYDVEYAMEEGVTTRQDLLNDLQFLTPPEGMGTAHGELVAVVEAGVSAMTTGEQAVEDWNACYWECPKTYRDEPGWNQFSRASAGITTRFDTARKGWFAALATSLEAANAVPLPPMPRV